jgi:uncharacterized RDD family membrane protein YckC
VAATLYFLLTGQAPFQGGDAAACIARIAADAPPPMRGLRPGIPPALDAVVLRGLERGRKQRWHDLDAFRQALLPFVSGSPTAARLGIRFAAYLIDSFVLEILTLPLLVFLWQHAGRDDASFRTRMEQFQKLSTSPVWLLLAQIPGLLYFSVLEGVWGCGPGKRFLGLRVRTMAGEPPGPGRVILRTVLFLSLLGLSNYVLIASNAISETEPGQTDMDLGRFGLSLAATVVGCALLFGTMRGRNGYRGLHEFLSGTHVVRAPEARPRGTFRSRPLAPDATPPDLAARVGPFAVRGAFPPAEGSRVLLGHDSALGREVLIRLRPADEPLSAARRELDRPTRLRWLGGGHQDGSDWDAFLAPAGRPLSDLVADEGPLSWSGLRPLLEQLTDELIAASKDRTVPAVLTPGQVWVQPDGGVLLLDFPLRPSAADAAATAPGEGERACLNLMGQVALLALEGAARPPSDAGDPVRAPLPLHAARLLDRLLASAQGGSRLETFQADLAATRDRPTEVTRGRRGAQLAILAPCVYLTSGAMVGVLLATILMSSPFASLAGTWRIRSEAAALHRLEAGTARELAAAALNPDPWVRLAGARRWEEDQRLADRLRRRLDEDRRRQKDRARCTTGLCQYFLRLQDEIEDQTPDDSRGVHLRVNGQEDVRKGAEWALEQLKEPEPEGGFLPVPVVIALAAWLSAWALAAFLARGGLTFLPLGIAVVRRDGRPASRLRCAGRALLVWTPVAALLLLEVCLDAWHLTTWPQQGYRPWLSELAGTAGWAALGLLPLYLALALWSPARSPHDRLAGTFLAPR